MFFAGGCLFTGSDNATIGSGRHYNVTHAMGLKKCKFTWLMGHPLGEAGTVTVGIDDDVRGYGHGSKVF